MRFSVANGVAENHGATVVGLGNGKATRTGPSKGLPGRDFEAHIIIDGT